MAKDITAKATKAGTATGSAQPVKRGRKPKAASSRIIRVPLERRDVDTLVAALSGDRDAQAELTVTAEPMQPTEPGENANAAEWRAYAIAVREFPTALDNWRTANARATRIRNRLTEAVNHSLAKAN